MHQKSGTQDKHRFTSYERDTESALDYAISRAYAAKLGRFQHADPHSPSGTVADPSSWNRYSYTQGDPINRVDALGLQDSPIKLVSCPAGQRWLPDTNVCVPERYGVDSLAELLWYESAYLGTLWGRRYFPMPDVPDVASVLQTFGWLAALLEGINEANLALARHPECLEMFGDTDPYGLLYKYVSKGLIRVRRTYPKYDSANDKWVEVPFDNVNIGAITVHGAASIAHPSIPGIRQSVAVITINPDGPYFTNMAQGRPLLMMPGFQGLTLPQARGAMIIHELLRVAGTRHDGGDPDRSREISEEVRDICFQR